MILVNFINKALILIGVTIVLLNAAACGQSAPEKRVFTQQDTLRGSLNPQRTWWDVQKYTIWVKPNYTNQLIEGKTDISLNVLKEDSLMQIDLQEPLLIDSVRLFSSSLPGANLSYRRNGNAWLLKTPVLRKGQNALLSIYYHGRPRKATRPPWDGGWIWEKDAKGYPWMSVSCQHLGASVWYPCKDHQSDEPDSGAVLRITIPDELTGVGNGRLKDTIHHPNGTTTWTWEIKNPINNYNIIPYIGNYSGFTETYKGEKGPLDCRYWVLDYNLPKAKKQFTQAASMLQCFEHWFGPYPFYEDGYQLIESPHLGMEHQSAIAYGNGYTNGYLGTDLSGTGWGLKWDFIIVHESGHEWFANSITTNDIADMWVHEGFTNYSETLYTQCLFGKEAGNDYVIGTRKRIQNDIPVIGPYGVNAEGSGDMYYKGGNLLHTLRQVINDDEKFRQILRGLNSTFYHQTVTTQQVENYINRQAGIDFSKVFDQYLRTTQIPVLQYRITKNKLSYRWVNCVKGFNLAIKIKWKTEQWIQPTEQWQSRLLPGITHQLFSVDRNFYIKVKSS
jgi:aminopeptidase N